MMREPTPPDFVEGAAVWPKGAEAVARAIAECDFQEPTVGDVSKAFRWAILEALEARGWSCVLEGGLLIATKPGELVGVALDHLAARQRTLATLRSFQGQRVLGLRCGEANLSLPHGIDAMASHNPPRVFTREHRRGEP